MSIDGGTVAWSFREPASGLQRVSYLKDGATVPQQVPMARDHNQASQPSLKNGRIAYIEDGLFDGTYGVRIQMYNIANGTTTALGAPSQPEWISTPVMTSSDVYWLIDTDYTDQDQTTLRRAHLGGPDGAVVTDVIPRRATVPRPPTASPPRIPRPL
ncbi:hypothetical protein E4K10_48455 [Streptomyces sp. T1317-0309]|nr:hypothetical protein E4K10_48455 [Streptomyces sp. T1317-0309]